MNLVRPTNTMNGDVDVKDEIGAIGEDDDALTGNEDETDEEVEQAIIDIYEKEDGIECEKCDEPPEDLGLEEVRAPPPISCANLDIRPRLRRQRMMPFMSTTVHGVDIV